MKEEDLREEKEGTCIRTWIVKYLPDMVSQHKAWVHSLGLRYLTEQRAPFLVDVSVSECVSLTEEGISDIFELYVSECCKQSAYYTVVAVSLCQNVRKIQHVRHLIPLLALRQFEEVLRVLAQRNHWSLVHELARGRPDAELLNLLRDGMDMLAYSTHPHLKECLELLIARCLQFSVLTMVAERLIVLGRGALFRSLLARDGADVLRMRFDHPTGWPLTVLGLVVRCLVLERKSTPRYRCSEATKTASSHKAMSVYGALLVTAIEAGLSSQEGAARYQPAAQDVPVLQRPTPLITATSHFMPALVKLLLDTGATTNHEVFQLSQQPLLTTSSCQNSGPSSSSVLVDLIQKAASTPRSLQASCVFLVSQCVGCGSDRAARVKMLPLPLCLQDQILFKDTLNEFIELWTED